MSDRKTLSSGVKESLCCCEYENMKGEKSHLLACCCDCEAFDEIADRLLKCQPVPSSTLNRLFETLTDRFRIPFCFGRGALKIRPDIVIPAVVVPSCLLSATLHPVMTVLSFLFMPFFVITFTLAWQRRDRHRRTQFFFSWAVSSIVSCYVVFQVFVVAFREVLLWEILLVFSLTFTLFYLLHETRKDAGTLKDAASRHKQTHKRTASNTPFTASGPLYDQVSGQQVDASHKLVANGNQSDMVSVNLDDAQPSEIKWVDSRTDRGGKVETYCEVCSFHKPPRAGHCNICQACVSVRDHHCIWIDSCVGGANHRCFLACMVLFIVTGVYASHLTFTTICTPKMYFDWFLLPNDCRWLYSDFLTAISFVTSMYVLMACSLVFCGLLFQLVLISQNLTAHELVHACRQGLTRFGLYALQNPNNKGFLQNWAEFWFLGARTASSMSPS